MQPRLKSIQRLACGIEVLDPAALTITHPQFLKGPTVGEGDALSPHARTEPDRRADLVLVPLGALDRFVDEQHPTSTSSGLRGAERAAGSVEDSTAPALRSSSLFLVEDPRDNLPSAQ